MKNLLDMMEASNDDLPDIYCDRSGSSNFMKGAEKALVVLLQYCIRMTVEQDQSNKGFLGKS